MCWQINAIHVLITLFMIFISNIYLMITGNTITITKLDNRKKNLYVKDIPLNYLILMWTLKCVHTKDSIQTKKQSKKYNNHVDIKKPKNYLWISFFLNHATLHKIGHKSNIHKTKTELGRYWINVKVF